MLVANVIFLISFSLFAFYSCEGKCIVTFLLFHIFLYKTKKKRRKYWAAATTRREKNKQTNKRLFRVRVREQMIWLVITRFRRTFTARQRDISNCLLYVLLNITYEMVDKRVPMLCMFHLFFFFILLLLSRAFAFHLLLLLPVLLVARCYRIIFFWGKVKIQNKNEARETKKIL